MNYLLDTNVISEPTKKQPNARVLQWFAAQPAETLFLSVLTLGELRRGILLLDDGKRRRALLHWLDEELTESFDGRVLDVNAAVMRAWAELQNQGQRQGRLWPVMDGLIAATALANDLTLTTRNTADFQGAGVALCNPWQA